MSEAGHIAASSGTETFVYATLLREGKEETVLVGGGKRSDRIKGALTILGWNREGRRLAKERGVEFPKDAPTHFWQVNWPSVFKKGNV